MALAVLLVVGTGWPTGSIPLAAASPSTATIGSLKVRACDTAALPGRQSWCGSMVRPWGTAPGSLRVGFTVITPAGADPGSLPAAPVVAIEGGPGFSAIDSAQTFAEMLGPVLDNRALIVMDARGTGRSAAVDCPSMRPKGDGSYAACGRHLGERVGDYSSAAAADDLAALVEGLGLGIPVLYGDSYGTFLSQVYAGRHPVAALILDGAYPVVGEDAWYGTQGPALRSALDAVCARDPSCTPGRTLDRLGKVLADVRSRPQKIRAPGADGRLHAMTIDAPTLVGVAFNGTYLTPTYRELDAALGAALDGDWLPLGRLAAEAEFPGGDPDPVTTYSPGQATAVGCHDYPQLFDYAASIKQRRAQVKRAVAAQRSADAALYGPFTIAEYLASDWAEQESCVTWPLRRITPGMAPGPAAGMPDVPVLVISGDLDTITTAAEGTMVAAQFPRAQHLIVANGLHVNALGSPDGCATSAVRAFIADPATYRADTPCSIPAITLAASYGQQAGSLPIGEAIAQTVADVLDRAWQTMGADGVGLRGGRWSLRGWPDTTITLRGYRLYQDLPVDGKIHWNASNGVAEAHLTVRGEPWSGCWNSLDGLGSKATAVSGDRCLA
jgi:pimeloyl-ACP methyl ester carboxylesterase